MHYPCLFLSLCMVLGLSLMGFAQDLLQVTIDAKAAECDSGQGEISVGFPDQHSREVELYDLHGELILSKTTASDHVTFTDLVPGVYSVKVIQQGASEYLKAVKVLNRSYDERIKLRTGVVDTSCRNIYRDGWTLFKGFPYTGFQDFDMTDYQSLVVYFFDDKGSNYQTTDTEDDGIVSVVSQGVDPGVYHVMLEYNGCFYPLEEDFIVSPLVIADFEVKSNYEVKCGEVITVRPESVHNYEYELYTQNGDLVETGKEFEIGKAGIYYLQNKLEGYCAITHQINVTMLGGQLVPEVTKEGDVCDGKITLVASTAESTNDEDEYRWYDFTTDQELSAGSKLEVVEDGIYYVRIGEPSNLGCTEISEPIEVAGLTLPYIPKLVLTDKEWCEGEANTLILEGLPDDKDFEISWYVTTTEGIRELYEAEGLRQLDIFEQGLYTVSVRTGVCAPNQTELEVLQQEDSLLVFDSRYDLCEYGDSNPLVLNAGDAVKAEWMVEGQIVGQQNTFMPYLPGSYRLLKYYSPNCYTEYTFMLTANCAAAVRFTTGISSSDPNKGFAVFMNSYVESLQLSIYDRWGQLLLYADETHPLINSSEGIWNAKSGRVSLPPANYTLVLWYQGADGEVHKQTSNLTVID
ncbi:hypothetical protein SYJ56_24515 [Algoriphagus sp. D3-2-R+10]|uniref:hypothetical protein n=1 Tax=Algoriphagus aurantiacus TaxID=3103948 RepID=UPI002B3CBE81|nr:hypothetical protein [Algoriphagus sp. D3-2-R+10]MEB2778495.1 hypothetical protein [Algoriphagus sp. D3-2-R+10]